MPYAGELAALTTAVCWSFTAIFFSEAGRRVGSFRVNSVRLLMAVTIYAVMLLVTTGRLFPPELNSSQVIWLAASGLVGLVIGDGCGFKALVMIGPRLTTLLWATAPIMATVIAWFLLGETLGWLQLTGIVVTVGGVSWVVAERRYKQSNHFNLHDTHPDSGTLTKGVILGLLAALGQAAGLIMSKHAMLNLGSNLDALPASFLRMLSSAIMIWLFAALRGKLMDTLKAFKDKPAMLLSLGGAVFGPFLGVWTSLIAVSLIPAGIAATLNATTPVWIIPNVIVYYKEKVSPRAVLGALLAVLGIALLIWPMTYLDYDRYDELVRRTLADYSPSRIVSFDEEVHPGYVDLRPFFGPGSINPAEVKIDYLESDYEIWDRAIAAYANEIAARMRKEGKIRKGPQVARIASLSLDGPEPSIVLQPVNYDLIASTGLALDLPHRLFDQYGGTLRDYYLSGRNEPSVTNNPLPTCLGICGLLLVKTETGHEVLVTKRSSHLASLENTIGPSAAGHIDYVTHHRTLADIIETGMRQEVREELNLRDEQFKIVPLAMATELFRGERPQLFCSIRTNLDHTEIVACLEAIPASEREFTSYHFLELDRQASSQNEKRAELNFETQMNLAILIHYLKN